MVYENGTSKGTFGTYTAGDFFAVERKNGVVYYKKNNQVFYTSTIPSTGVVYVDCSLYNTDASAIDVKLFTTAETLVAQYEYNELGQLVDKKLHNTGGTNFLQSIDYRYNIRSWLSSINNAALGVNTATNDETNDYFGIEFLYNTTQSDLGNTATFNGNISAAKMERSRRYGNRRDWPEELQICLRQREPTAFGCLPGKYRLRMDCRSRRPQ